MPSKKELLPQSMDKGQGLLGKSYGPDDDTVGEQLNALQVRGQKLAAKVAAMNPNPSVPSQVPLPQRQNLMPLAALKLKGKR